MPKVNLIFNQSDVQAIERTARKRTRTKQFKQDTALPTLIAMVLMKEKIGWLLGTEQTPDSLKIVCEFQEVAGGIGRIEQVLSDYGYHHPVRWESI